MVRKRLKTILVPIIAAGLMSGCRSSQMRQYWPFSAQRPVAHRHFVPFGHGTVAREPAPSPAPLTASPDSARERYEEPSEYGVRDHAAVPQTPKTVEPPKPKSLANAPREIPEAPVPAARPADADPGPVGPMDDVGDPIAALEALGGVVEFDENGNPLAVNLAETEFGDSDARLLADLTTLQRVDLTGTQVTHAGMVHLRSLTQLQMLLLNHTNVSDRGLKHLEPLTHLRFLGLTHTPITDNGLVPLRTLLELEYLLLSHTRVTADGLNHLKRLTRLQGLSLVGTRIADADLAELKQALPGCRFLTDAPPPAESLPAPSLDVPDPAEAPRNVPVDEGSDPFAPSETPHVPRTLDHGPMFQIPPAPEDEGPAADEIGPGGDDSEPRQPEAGPNLEGLGPNLPVEREYATLPESGFPLRAAVERISDDEKALQRLANAYGSERRWEDAVTVLQAARRHAPKNATVQYNFAVALAQSGKIDAARPHFVATIGEAAADYNLGLILYEQGRLDESESRFTAALRHQPNFPAARTWLNEVHKEQQAVKNLAAMKVLTNGNYRPQAVKRVAGIRPAAALIR